VVDLREYMDELRKRNELVEVDEPISLDLELPAIARKLMYRGDRQ